jgi:hypothetical protein
MYQQSLHTLSYNLATPSIHNEKSDLRGTVFQRVFASAIRTLSFASLCSTSPLSLHPTGPLCPRVRQTVSSYGLCPILRNLVYAPAYRFSSSVQKLPRSSHEKLNTRLKKSVGIPGLAAVPNPEPEPALEGDAFSNPYPCPLPHAQSCLIPFSPRPPPETMP